MIPKQWQAAIEVINCIEQAGFEAYIVGGAVRDFYLQKENADVDVTTSALPEEVQGIFSHTIDVGIEHGTVLVLDHGEPIEVTTYRTESMYTDHRRPDAVQFVRNLTEDLKRRDFTMNAMALSKEAEFIDLYGGREDIDLNIIRAVGNAVERFNEDALRMLRAIRFAGQLGFAIEESTLNAIEQKAASISFIAMERIQVELSKVWVSLHPARAIDYLQQTGLQAYLSGQFNVSEWTDYVSNDRQVGWAYFCLVNEQDTTLLSEYRCSNKDKQFVKQVLAAYNRLLDGIDEMDYLTFDLYVLQTAYQFISWQKKQVSISFEELEQKKNALPIQSPQQLAITGFDLMQWSSKKRGPWIKTMMNAALVSVVKRQVPNDKQQLKEWFRAFDDEG